MFNPDLTRQDPGKPTTDFYCFQCGVCCAKYQPQVSESEACDLAANLTISLQQFKDIYIDPRWPGVDNFLIRHSQGRCVFLQSDALNRRYRCQIHTFKPHCCRDWEFGWQKAECRQGLQDCWALTLDSSGNLNGGTDQILKFKEFLSSISDI